jgi:hypothetical protein
MSGLERDLQALLGTAPDYAVVHVHDQVSVQRVMSEASNSAAEFASRLRIL